MGLKTQPPNHQRCPQICWSTFQVNKFGRTISNPSIVHIEVAKFSNHLVNDVWAMQSLLELPFPCKHWMIQVVYTTLYVNYVLDPSPVGGFPLAMSYMMTDSRHQYSQLDSHHKVADPNWVFSKFHYDHGAHG